MPDVKIRKIIHETDCPVKRAAEHQGNQARKIIHETDWPVKRSSHLVLGARRKIIHETDWPVKLHFGYGIVRPREDYT